MRPARARIGLLLVVLVGWLPDGASFAEPVRKARRSTPAHPARSAPDITATITKPPLPVEPNASASSGSEMIPPPFKLPSAPRARVRACGETWRDMKLAGTTGDDDWRDFAFKCLVGKGPTSLAD